MSENPQGTPDATISETGTQPQPRHEDGGQTAAEPMMSEGQTAAVAHLGELRKQAADPTLDRDKRDAVMKKMSELSRHAFLGEKTPAWYGDAKPDPRATDTSEYDPMAEMSADAGATITEQEHAHLVIHGKVQGLDAEMATLAADFSTKAGLDRITAKTITERFAKHTAAGWGMVELTQADHAELFDGLAQRFGSAEKALSENAMARAYVEHVGLGEWVDKYAGSLQYDPHVITMLAYKARSLGLKAATT